MSNESQVIKYEVGGQEVKLSPSIVSQFITKGNAAVSSTEAVNFMQLCRYNELNPFLNEAYLVKFKGSPAQMITSKEAFMKRAENNAKYRGLEAGIVVFSKDGELVRREGALKMKDEELVGGWCRVFREDREKPSYVEISVDEFGKGQSTWKVQPANMIRKTAIVNALREAFPNSLGAMYTEDDRHPDDVVKQAEKLDEDDVSKTIMDEYKETVTNQPERDPDYVEYEEVPDEEVADGEQGDLLDGLTTNPKEG